MTKCDRYLRRATRPLGCLGAAAALSLVTLSASAQQSQVDHSLPLMAADPAEKGDGTLSAAAAAALTSGPLPFSQGDVAAKAAANLARDEAAKSAQPPSARDARAPRGQTAPLVASDFNQPGLSAVPGGPSPPDPSGAIGPTRYVQLVNLAAGIFNRTTGALIGSGTLDQLAGVAASVQASDPQIIWDATTNRFYYTMISIFLAADNRLSFGFSKTASPHNVTTGWCHYTLRLGTRFPDYPRLGDSQFFVIIGVNSFTEPSTLLGSDLIAINKPAAGTTCPPNTAFTAGRKLNLLDANGQKVFTPVPANEIDAFATGFVVARNGTLPSSKLWLFRRPNRTLVR